MKNNLSLRKTPIVCQIMILKKMSLEIGKFGIVRVFQHSSAKMQPICPIPYGQGCYPTVGKES